MNPLLDNLQLIRSGRRSLSLEVGEDLEIKVRAPFGVSERAISEFVRSRQWWIDKARREVHRRVSRVSPLNSGQLFWRGELYPFRVDASLPQRFDFNGKIFSIHPLWLNEAEETISSWFKKKAEVLLADRLSDLARQLQVAYKRFRLGSARTRWGSCSRSGTVTLHWRLVFTPDWVRDYVIYHELAHRNHFDHSASFWSAVHGWCPRSQDACLWLRDHAALLTAKTFTPTKPPSFNL